MIAQLRDEDPVIVNVTERERTPHLRCRRWMPLAQEPCWREPHHAGYCRTRWAVEYDAERHRTARAP